MFYLLCFGENCFSLFDFVEKADAELFAQKWVAEERFHRCVVCKSLCECFLKDDHEE